MNLGNSWESYFRTRDSISSVSQCKVECYSLGVLAYLEIGAGLRKIQEAAIPAAGSSGFPASPGGASLMALKPSWSQGTELPFVNL